jgi:hypothetical protein
MQTVRGKPVIELPYQAAGPNSAADPKSRYPTFLRSRRLIHGSCSLRYGLTSITR